MGVLYVTHGEVPATRLIEVTANSVSEMDKKGVNADVGHVSYDNGLMFSEWQVNSELFPMGKEGQPECHVKVVQSAIGKLSVRLIDAQRVGWRSVDG